MDRGRIAGVLRVSVDPYVNLSAIQSIAVHGAASTLCCFRTVKADHTTTFGLAILHLDISILNHT